MEIKEATKNAADYLKSFFPTAERLRLEEVEITDDDSYWNITLSYDDNPDMEGASFMHTFKKRFYKIFKIDATNGNVRSMKIRDF